MIGKGWSVQKARIDCKASGCLVAQDERKLGRIGTDYRRFRQDPRVDGYGNLRAGLWETEGEKAFDCRDETVIKQTCGAWSNDGESAELMVVPDG